MLTTELDTEIVDDRPLRILVGADVPADPNAGASGTVYQTNQALREMGHEVDEIWGPELGRRIHHGNLHYLLELPLAYRRVMRQRLARSRYDVVEFNQPHAYLAAADYRRHRHHGVFVNRSHGHEIRSKETLATWISQFGERRVSWRGLLSGSLQPLLDRQWSIIARSADGFHVSCSEDAEFLRDRYFVASTQIGVFGQGIPNLFSDVPTRAMTTSRIHRLLYVAQFAMFKAPMVVAQAVSTLLKSRPQLTMTWICDEAHHASVQSLLDPCIQSRVQLSGWRPQDELIHVFDEHGIFLFPSFFEGFGKTPLEAMSRGMCVVATCVGGMRDFIDDGITGRLVPPGRPDSLAQAVASLIDDPVKCESISQAARLKACEHTWDRCARELTTFYRRLIARKQGMTDDHRISNHLSMLAP